MKTKKITVQKCEFILLSDIPISAQGKVDVSESNDLTYGDANRTLVTIRRLLALVNWTKDKDAYIVTQVAEQFDPEMYVDLEN